MEMKFTYDSYEALICLLKEHQYQITDYHHYGEYDKSVILRHDVDYDVKKAREFALFEQRIGVTSSYFFLLTSDFYNLCSKKVNMIVREIVDCGHQIGLHFDETRYENVSIEEIKTKVEEEKLIMESIIQVPITTVSMHRPSGEVLEANLCFDRIVNSYGKVFFEDFKYVSDSRMRWREDVYRIVQEEEEKRLHILTHPFWYSNNEETTKEKIERFLDGAYTDRFLNLNDNFRDLSEYIRLKDIKENEKDLSKKEGKDNYFYIN